MPSGGVLFAIDGFNGFVCERFTHVAGEVKLNARLTICANRTCRQGITPKVLNVLDMALVQYERIDQVVVIPMGLRLVVDRFQDDHRDAGIEFVEHLPARRIARIDCASSGANRHGSGFHRSPPTE